jgi:hypothetical protein
MTHLARLMIAGAAAAALFSAPAMAMDSSTKLSPATQTAAAVQHTTVAANETQVTPEFCIAADKCAVALPASYLVRYDQRMDEVLAR